MNERDPTTPTPAPVGAETNGNGSETSAQDDPAFHQRLRAVTRDFNLRELSELTGVSLETARRYLEGKGPGLGFIKRLCEALGLSADWLLLGRGSPLYRQGVPLGQMDSTLDDVLDGLGRYLKRLHLELARGGTGLNHAVLGPALAGQRPTNTPVPATGSHAPSAEFVDPFAGESARQLEASDPIPPHSSAPVHARLLLGPLNGFQLVLPGESPPEILVRLDESGAVVLSADGVEAHAYRKIFDRVYRWVSPIRFF